MPDFRMLNGHPKATAVVRFDHSAFLIFKSKKLEFPDIKKMKKFIQEKNLEVNIEHIHPARAKQ